MTPLALRYAWRELRGGLRGFGVFVACIALGVMAIAGVGSVAQSLADGLSRAGSAILGGDLNFSLVQREANDGERSFLERKGAVAAVATLPTMARTGDGRTTLVEIKAVDGGYPLFGTVATEPDIPFSTLLARNGDAFGAAADPALLTRLDLKLGDRITIGKATIELRTVLKNEPDRLSGGIGLGPRLLVSQEALRASALLQPGSLVRWRYRLRLPAAGSTDSAVSAVEQQARTEFPDAGWDIRTRKKASPQLERNVERFSQFLTLVALTALLVGGVGVANAVASHLARKRDAIATMKALGATGAEVFGIYCSQIVLVALFATLIGAGSGAALPFAIVALFGGVIPLPVAPAFYPAELFLSIAYGLLTALAFAMWPLGRAHDISVSMLFRDQVAAERAWPRRRYVIGTALIIAVLAALAILAAYDRRLAIMFVVSAAVIFLALRLVAMLTMALARRLPRQRSTLMRLAVTNIYRPGALTPSVVLSLGLGLSLLVTLVEIDSNLHRQFAAALPEKAPSFFFIDIPSADAERFDAFVRGRTPGSVLERVPMLRGRIIAAAGIKAENLKPGEGSAWVLRGDRGITYAAALPAGSRLVAGDWWPADYSGPPLVSLENRTAEDLKLKLGDAITVNVLGRSVTARIANLRAVDWQSSGDQLRARILSRYIRRSSAHRHRHADLRRRRHPSRGGGAYQDAGRRLSHRLRHPRQGRARCRRSHRRQPGARVARRKLGRLDRRGARARRRARGRPAIPHLRCRRAEDFGGDAPSAHDGLRARISSHRPCRRDLRGGGRLGDRPAGDHPRHGVFVRLDGAAGGRNSGFRAFDHRPAGAHRHFQRARA